MVPRQAGAYAEYVTAPSRHFARKPETLDHLQAGALPLAALTAWHALVDTAGVTAGDRLLIHAAAGGVGHLAAQIASARGADVIGTARQAKHDVLAVLGVDYTATRFEDAVRVVDVVVDLVGGEYSLRSVQVLRPGGQLVSVPSALPEGLHAAAGEHGVRVTGILVEPDYASLDQIGGPGRRRQAAADPRRELPAGAGEQGARDRRGRTQPRQDRPGRLRRE